VRFRPDRFTVAAGIGTGPGAAFAGGAAGGTFSCGRTTFAPPPSLSAKPWTASSLNLLQPPFGGHSRCFRENTMRFSCLAMALVMAAPSLAHEYKVGGLHIDHPVIRVASSQSKTGAGFMTIMNHGKKPDRLMAVETTAANRADLHGTVAVGTVMQMRSQAGGVPVPAGATVKLAPGGLHVMFIGLKAPVPPGTSITARLLFEKAGAVDVQFKAEAAAATTHQH